MDQARSMLAISVLLSAAACGGGAVQGPASTQQTMPVAQQAPPPPPAPNYSGLYRGPNRLEFAITEPVVRQMPPETHMGTVEVYDRGEATVTFNIRILTDGDPCTLQAQRGSMGLAVLPGQTCQAHVTYDATPVVAAVQVQEGTATFAGGGLQMSMRGPFIARAAIPGGVLPLQGVAAWRFEGVR